MRHIDGHYINIPNLEPDSLLDALKSACHHACFTDDNLSAGNGRWEFVFPYLRMQGFKVEGRWQPVSDKQCRSPYPIPPVPFTPPSGSSHEDIKLYGIYEIFAHYSGVQSQLVCSGCQKLLLYAHGATSVCCAVCNAVTNVPSPGTEMAQLVCGGCHTLLMYIRGATSVQCSSCHTFNLALEGKKISSI
ncbi:protein LOL1 isoform X1 [Cinnamomum micranthum f. kanehirae]|uniref:Protein LOL1 isoform X1 n=1 Tax=Cinnamomum micranthum f. kanehirae TaxID=337451 RepID=A0A3S3N8K9_9MAGN|nr:protein LOL1 isoform X1 [Cinnamomum micranthum f. kanehirae]